MGPDRPAKGCSKGPSQSSGGGSQRAVGSLSGPVDPGLAAGLASGYQRFKQLAGLVSPGQGARGRQDSRWPAWLRWLAQTQRWHCYGLEAELGCNLKLNSDGILHAPCVSACAASCGPSGYEVERHGQSVCDGSDWTIDITIGAGDPSGWSVLIAFGSITQPADRFGHQSDRTVLSCHPATKTLASGVSPDQGAGLGWENRPGP
jgi:hypothetical protein